MNSSLSSSSWVSSTGTFTNFAGSSGNAIALGAVTGGSDTYTLTFNVASGHQASITSYSYWRQRSASGPTAISSVTINGTTVSLQVTLFLRLVQQLVQQT
jgi:hypothetical protein